MPLRAPFTHTHTHTHTHTQCGCFAPCSQGGSTDRLAAELAKMKKKAKKLKGAIELTEDKLEDVKKMNDKQNKGKEDVAKKEAKEADSDKKKKAKQDELKKNADKDRR